MKSKSCRSISILYRIIITILLTLMANRADGQVFTPLGHLHLYPQSGASAVSGDGFGVVGTSDGEAFRWTESEGMVGLGDLPGGSSLSRAGGVSEDGSVIVGSSSSSVGGLESFYWTETGGMVGMGILPLAGGSRAFDVSHDGLVVVGDSGGEPFRWTEADGMIGLGLLPGQSSASASATSVSDDGSVVAGGTINYYDGDEAFRWTESGGMVGLGDLPGGIFNSLAGDVSGDGTAIVGRSYSAIGIEAFRWTEVGGMVGLGDLPGGSFGSSADATSHDGSIVVGTSQGPNGSEAFLWDSSNGMRSLQTVLTDDYGVDLTGWRLWLAHGVSADGNVIVGRGYNPNGDVEAWRVDLTILDAVVNADSFLVTRGTHVSGGVVELAESDNADLSIQRAVADIQSRTEFEVKAVSPVASPSSLELTLEGSVFARSAVNQTIELRDYVAGQWEQVDTRAATRFTDSTVTVAATGDLSRFVESGTMCIKARIHYQSPVARQRFSSSTDQFIWTIGQ